MACCLVYRGNVSTLEANTAVDQVKRSGKINLVEWCPTGFKVGLNKNGPGNVEDSQIMPTSKQVTLISNSTAVQQVFGRVCNRFDRLFAERAFLNHYIMSRTEEMELIMAREDMTTLKEFYDEIKAEKSAVINRQSSLYRFTAPEATEEERQQQATRIENEFEARRSTLRQSI